MSLYKKHFSPSLGPADATFAASPSGSWVAIELEVSHDMERVGVQVIANTTLPSNLAQIQAFAHPVDLGCHEEADEVAVARLPFFTALVGSFGSFDHRGGGEADACEGADAH